MAEVMTATPTMGTDGIEWKLCNVSKNACGSGKPQDPYPAIDLGPNTGPQDVIFVINDPAHLGIKFATNAFWMMPGKGKHPTNPSVDSNNQITGVLQPSPSVLIVSDKNNGNQQWFSYRLNFVDNANNTVNPIDPDWKNGGGGGTHAMSNPLATAGLLLSLASLLAILFVIYQNSSLRRMIAGGRSGPASGNPG
ncbi:hypothetical protein [Sphingomonas hankyongi]|uniref:Uncharacterized protein n=1 Tax=Sphingomonas hankyongi TaxID=2908209 RepID=A0ABT0S4N7_9SPHN|nr:hypothetical protein [Sphingomonas hankyongi]MCL6730832.1 hypothetical protein [Sphingomonas hankyongi]